MAKMESGSVDNEVDPVGRIVFLVLLGVLLLIRILWELGWL